MTLTVVEGKEVHYKDLMKSELIVSIAVSDGNSNIIENAMISHNAYLI